MTLRALFEAPVTPGLSLDDPQTTLARRDVLRRKAFLRKIYLEWYDLILAALPDGPGRVLELGSGAAFLNDLLPSLVTSEVVAWEGVSLVADARALPLADQRLKAIVMTNVFHHIGDARAFLREAARAIRPGGVVAMVEPWVTPWSRFVYGRFHDEPFLPEARESEFRVRRTAVGRQRRIALDRVRARPRDFPRRVPGVANRDRAAVDAAPISSVRRHVDAEPDAGRGIGFWRTVERAAAPIMDRVAMFAAIILRRQDLGPLGLASSGEDLPPRQARRV